MSAQILSYMQPSKRGHEKKNTSQLLEFQIKVKLNQPVLFYRFLCALLFRIAAPGSTRVNQTLGLHRKAELKLCNLLSQMTLLYTDCRNIWKNLTVQVIRERE